jgi:hypothetical protein
LTAAVHERLRGAGEAARASIDRLQDVHANLIWSPTKALDLGAELMWGERRNQNGAEGNATRLGSPRATSWIDR